MTPSRLLAVACFLALTGCDNAGTNPAEAVAPASTVANVSTANAPGNDYLQATYALDGEPITLRDGRAERRAFPDSAAVDRFSILEGSTVVGDVDGNGQDDVAFVLVQEGGGTGTFSHLVTATQHQGHYRGSNALFLGDRIGKPTIALRDGVLEVRFLDRPDDAPFSKPPTRQRVVQARIEGPRLEALSGNDPDGPTD
jgi:hypothetical protein